MLPFTASFHEKYTYFPLMVDWTDDPDIQTEEVVGGETGDCVGFADGSSVNDVA